MFGISLPELLVIIVFVIIFVDPKDIPKVVRGVADFIKKIRAIGNEFTEIIDRELSEPKKYIKDLNGQMQETYDLSDLKPVKKPAGPAIKQIEAAPEPLKIEQQTDTVEDGTGN